MTRTQFHTLKIASTRPQTQNGIALRFDVPAELEDTFSFLPGQYVTLRHEINGKEERRSYSICSAQNQSGFEVGIKRVPDGVFSNFAMTLNPGDEIEVMPPQGRFTAEPGGEHRYLLIAAGSGITPCLSIAKSVMALEPASSITLIYGNQSPADTMFRQDVDGLKDAHVERFQLIYVMSRERQTVDFLNGRITPELLQTLSQHGLVEPNSFDAVYLCGPQAMTEACATALATMGVETDQIHTELFNTDDAWPVPERISREAASGANVSIILDGSERSLTVDGGRDTVLQAAQSAGLDLPFSCAGGMCCTCRCKVVEGEASMDLNYSLQDWEIEEGFVLACQARPKTQNLVLDFDSV